MAGKVLRKSRQSYRRAERDEDLHNRSCSFLPNIGVEGQHVRPMRWRLES
jgi:hypothetical protein